MRGDKGRAEEGISKDELTISINQLNERLERVEKRGLSVLPSNNEEIERREEEPFKEIKKLRIAVTRSWGVRASDVDGTLIIKENRGKEEGGDIGVEISDGQGSMIWKINSTKLDQSLLYERVKKIFVELLEK